MAKINYAKTLKCLEETFERYLSYCKEYILPYEKYINNIDSLNEKFKKNPMGFPREFQEEAGISLEEFMEKRREYELYLIASDVTKHFDKLHIKVVETFIDPDTERTYYPATCREWLYHIRDFCYEGTQMIPLEEQNERLNNYVHFRAGMKKPKYFGDYKEV